MQESVVFIGGGNMARSLIGGLRRTAGRETPVTVIEPDAAKREALADEFGVQCAAESGPAVGDADAVVLAVKPQMAERAARALATALGRAEPVIVSIAAGVPLAALRAWLGETRTLVRCMPNTPALIGAGASALYADPDVGADQRALAEAIMAAAGTTVWVEREALINAVTATSGSGPAYFFAFMEAMAAGAEAQGLAPETARALVSQTALGAARMALESGDDPATLRANVTSPGGTTEAALAALSAGDLQALVGRAMAAASARAEELARDMS